MNKGWNIKEVNTIYDVYQLIGPSWQDYVQFLPNRTPSQIKLKFHNTIKRGKALDPDLLQNEDQRLYVKFAQLKVNKHGGNRKVGHRQLINIQYQLESFPHEYTEAENALFDTYIKYYRPQ